MSRGSIARVAVSSVTYTIDKPYDYEIPEELIGKIKVGCRVMVGFGSGNRKTEALVLGICDSSDFDKLKPVISLLDEEPVVDENSVRLALWLREQCFCTLYDVLRVMLPAGIWYRLETMYSVKSCDMLDAARELASKLPAGVEIVDFIFSQKGEFTEKKISDALKLSGVDAVLNLLVKNDVLTEESSAKRKHSDKTERMARLICTEDELEKYLAEKKPKAGQRDILDLLKIGGCMPVSELRYFTGASLGIFKTLEKNHIIDFCEQEIFRRPKIARGMAKEDIHLNSEQQAVFDKLNDVMSAQAPACALLHGVTGSGKTLVYIKLIESALAEGKTALMLVPEIALTPQMVERFSSCFGDSIAILHSALAAGERMDEWKRIKNGAVKVVVGTRSAVFAPLKNLGIIILDEEHEHSYKSGNTPRYHARDVAKFRCVADSALLLLGSATPSVDSMYQAESGKYLLCKLEKRFNRCEMPRVIISDMRNALRSGNAGSIGDELKNELAINIERGEQSILFLNRRGANKYAVCEDCGEVFGCPNCSVSLTYHSANRRMMCHHCGYSEDVKSRCSCGGRIRFIGVGTQRVESELEELFPGVEVIRMDTDTTFAKTSHQTILKRFREENIPILLGTQMITKGLDFENVTLVGVLAADQALYVDNYHAAEDTFSLITQVVGRAGRGSKEGRAVLQTFSPKNSVIEFAANQDYNGFYKEEIRLRKARGLPPLRDIVSITVFAEEENDAVRGCMRLLGKLAHAKKNMFSDVEMEVFGPSPAPVARVSNRFRFRIQICGCFDRRMRALISGLVRDFKSDRQNRMLQITVDVNSPDM